MLFTRGITIDNEYFDIPMVSLKRRADVLDRYAKRNEQGDMLRKIIGVYFNYTLSVGIVDDDNLYNRLYNKLTEPTEFHEVQLPINNGTYTFTAYISSVEDEYLSITDSGAKFQNLTCKFTAKSPARR